MRLESFYIYHALKEFTGKRRGSEEPKVSGRHGALSSKNGYKAVCRTINKEYGLREPELIDMGSDFRINLYLKKAITDQNGVIDPRERDTNDTKADTNDTYEKAVLNTIQNDPSV